MRLITRERGKVKRKVKYIDVGDMTKKEAEDFLKRMMAKRRRIQNDAYVPIQGIGIEPGAMKPVICASFNTRYGPMVWNKKEHRYKFCMKWSPRWLWYKFLSLGENS